MVVVWLFLVVPWVCLQFVIVVFPDHTHLLFFKYRLVIYLFEGNLPLFTITRQGHHELRVDLEDWEGNTRFAKYRIFNIGHPAELYKLTALGYTGDAGKQI